MAFKASNKHRGWTLVETGHRYYHAYKGSRRVLVGLLKRGDKEELCKRFKRIVDEMEDGTDATESQA